MVFVIIKYFGIPGLGFVLGYYMASEGSLKGKIDPWLAGILGGLIGLGIGLLILPFLV